MPATLSVPMADFHAYKDVWVSKWRKLGHIDMNGEFIPPITFSDALKLPDAMLNVFYELDDWVARLTKQRAGKGKK